MTSIKDVSAEEWNEVVAGVTTSRHEVLELEESNTTRENSARYFLLRDEQKCLQAVSVAICVDNDSEHGVEGFVLGRIAERSNIVQNCFRPALICGLFSHGSPVYVRSGEIHMLWVKRILTVMEVYAEKHMRSIGFIGVLSEQSSLIEQLGARGYCKANGLPVAKAMVTWKDEDSYLNMLRNRNKNYYKAAKNEINRFRKSGISVSEWDGSDIQGILSLLEKHHNERNKIKFRILPEYLSNLNIRLEEDCLIYIARKAGKLVGVVILLKNDNVAWAWKVGVDHEADENCFTYFNLAYYYFLGNAQKFNFQTIWYGTSVLNAKIRRGCNVEFTHFYYKPRSLYQKLIFRVLFALQRFWYLKKFSSFIEASY